MTKAEQHLIFYDHLKSQEFVLQMLIDMEEEKGIWSRYIFKFTIDVEFVARIEGNLEIWRRIRNNNGISKSLVNNDELTRD